MPELPWRWDVSSGGLTRRYVRGQWKWRPCCIPMNFGKSKTNNARGLRARQSILRGCVFTSRACSCSFVVVANYGEPIQSTGRTLLNLFELSKSCTVWHQRCYRALQSVLSFARRVVKFPLYCCDTFVRLSANKTHIFRTAIACKFYRTAL